MPTLYPLKHYNSVRENKAENEINFPFTVNPVNRAVVIARLKY